MTQAYVALGTTMATYCAQNIGAGKVQRIRSGFRSATIMSFVYAVISGILIMTVGKYMTYLFVSGDVADGILPMMAGVAELVGRGIVAVIAAGKRSYVGVCLASPIAWIFAAALLIVMYFYIMKHDMKKFEGYEE